jgi:hypothetical protein
LAASTFLLDAADRQHLALQRDFTGHDRSPSTGRRVSSDTIAVTIVTPAGRTVLRDRSRRHVHVQLGVLEELRIDLPLVGVGADPRQAARADSFITSPS